jgi:hypothetical protein
VTIQLERLTEDFRAPEQSPVPVSRTDTTRPAPPLAAAQRGDRLMRELPVVWAVAIAVGWPLAVAGLVILEPAPVDPTAPEPLVVSLLGSIQMLAVTGAIIAAIARRRAAAASSTVAAGIGVVFAVACPATGHHALAPWWFGTLAISGALVYCSVAAWRRS